MSKFKWCFIGTGKLANHIAEEILASGRHEIVSCYTRNPDNGRAFAAKFGCTAYEDAGDAINAEGVEGVYVVTPHNAHKRFVKLALELGKPVLCEKPFTVEAKDTDELIALSKEKNVYLCEAMWTWFAKPANTVKAWVDEGRIGAVRSARFTYCINSINYAPRVADPRRAGGALLDITVYPITYAYRLFGNPVKIESRGLIKDGIDLWDEIEMEFSKGEKVRMRASIVDYKGMERMVIKGEKGRISAPFYHFGQRAKLRKSLFFGETFKGTGSGIGYLPEFDTVASEIREGLKESRMVPLKATSDVMHIIDTVREQIGLEYPDLE
ncbi:MAG: Gfo/Idh/MocA family oxidoreductase [Lachnospiraceae bacterium]|nr:Gfo/Idh/MocA family oxidoreductase [Lachnospiraceae bacterium]